MVGILADAGSNLDHLTMLGSDVFSLLVTGSNALVNAAFSRTEKASPASWADSVGIDATASCGCDRYW